MGDDSGDQGEDPEDGAIYHWQGGSNAGESLEEKILRLEADKHGLQLQISILKDQLDAQDEKIRELEYCLDDKRTRLITAEQMLQNVIVYFCMYEIFSFFV